MTHHPTAAAAAEACERERAQKGPRALGRSRAFVILLSAARRREMELMSNCRNSSEVSELADLRWAREQFAEDLSR